MKKVDFKNTPIHKLYISLFIPTFIAVISNSLYCIVDVYFIAKGSGNLGIAALNIAMPIFTIQSFIGLLFGFGTATVMSVAEARKENYIRNQAFTLSVFLMILIGSVITLFTVLFLEEFALLLGATDSLLPYVCTYLRPICISSVPFILMYSLNAILRCDHNPKLAMYALLCGNIFNMIFDYIFVDIFRFGIFGAAFATSLSPVVILSVSLLHFRRKERVHFTRHFYNPLILKRIINAGAGSGMMEISSGIIIYIFNFVILKVAGELDLAAYGIIANIAYVVKGIVNGFAQAAQPILSYHFGAGNKTNVKKAFHISLLSSGIFALCLYGIFVVFAKEICSPFSDHNPILVDKAARGVILYFSSLLCMSINGMYLNYYQSIEQGKIATVMAILKGFVLVIVMLLLFVPVFGMDGVYLSVCGAELLCFLYFIFNSYKGSKTYNTCGSKL